MPSLRQLLDELLAQASPSVAPPSHGTPSHGSNGGGSRFAAGFQFDDVTDSSGHRLVALGASGAGGTLGLAVPDAELALAVTVSKLSPSRKASSRLVDAMLSELGLRLAPGAGLLAAD